MSTAVLKFEQESISAEALSTILECALAASPDPFAISEAGRLVYTNPSFATLSPARPGGNRSYPEWQTTDFVAGRLSFVLTTLRREPAAAETLHLALMGRLVGGVAHDFNNLLTGILLYCDLLQDKLPGADPLRARMDEIRSAAEQGAGIIRQLMTLGREQKGAVHTTSFDFAIRELAPMLRHLAGENIRITADLADNDAAVGISLAEAQQVVLNLVLNARDAMPQGGSVHLRTQSRPFEGTGPGERMFELTVSDDGPGMDAKVVARIFDPFFTTKARGRGTGMGLTTVRRIVEDAGGLVCVDTAPGSGTRMTVRLPEIGPGDQSSSNAGNSSPNQRCSP
ncbi:MAG TPA: ATP-binding protein [Terriglobales bacterium]